MSSYSSDGEYGDRNHLNVVHSDSENDDEHHLAPVRGGFKGPCTPKSMSPRSPNSPFSPRRGSKSPDKLDSPQSESQAPESPIARGRGPRSPLDPHPGNRVKGEDDDDDVHSDISSCSSLLNKDDQDEEDRKIENGEVDKSNSPKLKSINHAVPDAEDLSDVSDLEEDSDGLEESEKKQDRDVVKVNSEEEESEREIVKHRARMDENKDKRDGLNVSTADKEDDDEEDGEQLDFEADDQPEVEKEDGEIGAAPGVSKEQSVGDKKDDDKSADEGEVKDEDSLEEGEVTDEGDPKPEKPPICRFFSRGACTWGVNCRFLHPGVTDKGNYSMFEVGRPMVAPPVGSVLYPDHRSPYGHVLVPPARAPPGAYGPVPIRRDEALAASESAWERGLRQAKEMMRKSTKRKETDMDFEEKKMNLSIGQDEIDKENDYYTRAASPIDEPETWNRLSPRVEGDVRRPVRVVERYEDIIPEPVSPSYYDKYESRRHEAAEREYPVRRERKYYVEDEFGKKAIRKEKMVREVIVQRVEKQQQQQLQRVDEKDNLRRRGDEWADPWMRSKSPNRKQPHQQPGHRSRKTSYSSGSSSFTSRSNSRSSSNSSYTSYSRSRSPSLSRSRSPAARPRRPRTPPLVNRNKKNITSPPVSGNVATDSKFKPVGGTDKKGSGERFMMMNPPAPTPKRPKERPLSPSAMRKVGLNPPAPTPKIKTGVKHGGAGVKPGKVRSRKSRSSSGSGSSGSSSDSSRSSYSSSSSSTRGGTPPVRPVKQQRGQIEINERLAAQSNKLKALDALKVSGQKPQIKLTLKPAEVTAAAVVSGKKRPAEEPLTVETVKSPNTSKSGPTKKTTSRREELLKQLKAVEDAIARKRSKI